MGPSFEIQDVHRWWAEARAKRWGLQKPELLLLLSEKDGKCRLSDVHLLFGDGNQAHPLFAELDHISPGSDRQGLQVICRSLNGIKGSLPYSLFSELVNLPGWIDLMDRWRNQALLDYTDREAFQQLLLD